MALFPSYNQVKELHGLVF